MSAINFPDPSQSPWTNSSTGITYTYSNGVWKALSSEETFLKPADADLAYLKKNDGGTQQVISGGGGLNIIGDVKSNSKTIPTAVMGASAPSNPGICDFWTDTSGDTPVLKSWNGTEWVEVGGGPSGPVGAIVENPEITADNLNYAPATISATPPVMANSTLFSRKWYKDGVELEGVGGSVYAATEPGTYRYEETWGDEAGNILRPDVSIILLDLDIQKPVVTPPATPLNPGYASFVSSEPAVDQGEVTTWGTATWEVSSAADFDAGTVYTETVALTASGVQSSPYFTQLDAVTGYYVRVKYGSSLPSGIESEFSNAVSFTTSESYDAIQSVTALNEGNSVTFTISTEGVTSGTTLYYSIDGSVSSSDFTDNAISGSFTIQSDSASVTKTLLEDGTTEGNESFVFKIHTGSTTGPVVYSSSTVTVYDTSKTVYIGTYKFKGARTYTSGAWTVPANTTYIQVVAWGSGGEPDGYPNGFPGGSGGGGGWATAVIPVTAGESLNVGVGRDGNNGGGGKSFGGTGGGFSGVFRGSTPLIIAGGGGGGAVNNTAQGGAGGGYSGQGSSDGYGGGSQSGASNRYLQGGTGGGGGYYGGNGGSWSNAAGGGSGYIGASGNIHASMSTGSWTSPAGTGHADYDSSHSPMGRPYGQGGSGNNSGDSTYGSGLLIIHCLNSEYNPSSTPVLPSSRNIIQTYTS